MKKIKLIIGLAAVMLAGVTVRAGFGGYSPYNISNQVVTAPSYLTNYAYVNLPSVSFTAVSTNLLTRTTNYVFQSVSVTNVITFVYDSSIMGTNFSTNFPPANFVSTNLTGFQSVPQSTGNSNLVQETFN